MKVRLFGLLSMLCGMAILYVAGFAQLLLGEAGPVSQLASLDLSAWAMGGGGLALAIVGAALLVLPRRRPAAVTAAPPKPAASKPPAVRQGADATDREFLPAALELLETPPSPINMAALWLICAAFVTAGAFLYFGKLDIHAVAPGRIQPNGRSKVVQPLEPGRVVSVTVDNGSIVAAGDLLLELDPTETGADRESLTRDLESLSAEAARRAVAVESVRAGRFAASPIPFGASVGAEIRRRESDALRGELAELAANVASLDAQIDERKATLKRLSASIDARSRLLALTNERVKMRTDLTDAGALSRAMVIDSLQQHEMQMITQATEEGQLAETEAGLKTLRRKSEEAVSHFVADQTQKMIDAERKTDRFSQDLIKARSKNDRTSIRAPIAGTVQQLAVTTVGQVVTSGQALMTIVPTNSALEIEAQIANLDIGFVAVGQPVVVKVEAFPFTRYGTLDGRVTKLSHDAVDERAANALTDPGSGTRPQGSGPQPNTGQNLVFPATIALNRWALDVEGKAIPLSPGMAVTVEVLTGQRRAIDYLLAPLREVTSKSAKER